MAIPDFQSIMRPLLDLLGDGQEHRSSNYYDTLAQQFALTPEERQRRLASGRQEVFNNRVGWSVTYLAKAGLVERTGRGTVRITAVGREVLQTDPPRIDIVFLFRFPAFEEFRGRPASTTATDPVSASTARMAPVTVAVRLGDETTALPPPNIVEEQTPGELLEASYGLLRQALAEELLDRINDGTPRFFEQLVVDLLVAMGYGGSRLDAGQAVGQSGDDGVDGIIKEDRLGLDFVYIQAKRWDQSIGRPLVQAFAGSLEGQRARKGVFITTSTFTRDAKDYVTRIEKRIVLIDGAELAQLLIDYGVGVIAVATYHVKRIDADYFDDDA